MTRSEAQRLILREWRALPASERQTETQAAAFAMKVKGDYPFRYSGDRYQIIKGWLFAELPKRS
jgi:hypothetical protein